MQQMNPLFSDNISYSLKGLEVKTGKLEDYNLRKVIIKEGLVQPLVLDLPPRSFDRWGTKIMNLFCQIETDLNTYLVIYLMERVNNKYLFINEVFNDDPCIIDKMPTKVNNTFVKVGMLNTYLMLRILSDSDGINLPRSLYIPKGFNYFTPQFKDKVSLIDVLNPDCLIKDKPKKRNTPYLNDYIRYMEDVVKLEQPIIKQPVIDKIDKVEVVENQKKELVNRESKPTKLVLLPKPKKPDEVKELEWSLIVRYIDPTTRKSGSDLTYSKKLSNFKECEKEFKHFKSTNHYVVKVAKAINIKTSSSYSLV